MTADVSPSKASLGELLATTQRRAMLIGGSALILGAIGWATDQVTFYQSWLLAFAFWWQIAIGCLGISLLHQLVGGAWGRLTRPTFAAGMTTLPLLAILFLPVLAGMKSVFPWMDAEFNEANPLMKEKLFFLNASGFYLRAVIYFCFWCVIALVLNRRAVRSLKESGSIQSNSLKGFSGASLFHFFLFTTFASFDWMMSLDPLWFSAMYGGLIIVGGAVGAFCVAVIVATKMPPRMGDMEVNGHDDGHHKPLLGGFPDLGTLLLAFILIWVYFAFSQFLIIWSGNLPDEVVWYAQRNEGGWKFISVAIMVLHFGLPFFCLLQREFKEDPKKLAMLAIAMLGVRLLDVAWTMMPSFNREGFAIRWTDPVLVIAIGGVWVAAMCWALPRFLSPAALEHRAGTVADDHPEKVTGKTTNPAENHDA